MIKIDLKNMTAPKLDGGLSLEEVNTKVGEVEKVWEKFKSEKSNMGFTKLPFNFEELSKSLEEIDGLAFGMDTIVVIGIGGSDLGTRALFRALQHQYHNQTPYEVTQKGLDTHIRLFFAGDTTDPEPLADLLDILDFSKTLFIVVSKSGNTVEQASVFVYLRELVLKKVGEGSDLKHFVFLTDPSTGTLRDLSNKMGYKTIPIPTDVGGRFSVLSSVGMIPAHLVGLDVELILKGAEELDSELSNNEEFRKNFQKLVAQHYLYYKSGKKISVLIPYQYSLSEFAKWFRQLWAESLGKKLDVEGKEVFEGITPVAALGPTDQHSQLQLYNEGPNDKIFTFISVENSRRNLDLPKEYKNVEAFDFLKGHNFHELLNYEQQTTAFALTKNQRPNSAIIVPQLDEYHMGQLFYFFELILVHLGMLLNLNSFDQPGVELSKNAMYGVLGKTGYEKDKEDFENYLK